MPEREGGGVLRVKAVFCPSLGGLIFPPRGKPTGEGRFRAKGLWDARGRQQGWWCPDSPGWTPGWARARGRDRTFGLPRSRGWSWTRGSARGRGGNPGAWVVPEGADFSGGGGPVG